MYGSPVLPIMLSFSDEATSTTKVPDPVVADGSATDTDSETEVISSKKGMNSGSVPFPVVDSAAEVFEKEMEPDSKVAGSLFPFSDEAIEYSYSFYYS